MFLRIFSVFYKTKEVNGKEKELMFFKEKDFKRAKMLFEREFLKRKLKLYSGNISKTAKEIGLERTYLQKKLKELGLTSFEDE